MGEADSLTAIQKKRKCAACDLLRATSWKDKRVRQGKQQWKRHFLRNLRLPYQVELAARNTVRHPAPQSIAIGAPPAPSKTPRMPMFSPTPFRDCLYIYPFSPLRSNRSIWGRVLQHLLVGLVREIDIPEKSHEVRVQHLRFRMVWRAVVRVTMPRRRKIKIQDAWKGASG